MPASGQIGNRKSWNGKAIVYLHGLGCVHHDNCFTCPLKDCYLDYKKLPEDAYVKQGVLA